MKKLPKPSEIKGEGSTSPAKPPSPLNITLPSKPAGSIKKETIDLQPDGEGRDLLDETEFRQILCVQGGDKYKLGPVVAEGGMGIVREALDLSCRRIVAIKALPQNREIPKEDVARFIEEAQITSRLEHPNIPPIHELGFDVDKNAFYTMKYVRGVTLTEILLGIRKAKGTYAEQFPLSRLLNIFQKVCDAVAYSHSKGIAHCDLKPDNIMVCDFGEVMVMDWGLACRIGSPLPVEKIRKAQEEEEKEEKETSEPAPGKVDSSARTTTGRILGTPGFIAPERIRGGILVDARSDIYSLGSTLYSILTLRPPISGDNISDLIRRILLGVIRRPADWNHRTDPSSPPPFLPHCPDGRIPEALSDATMKCLELYPDDRFATVQDLQEEVEAYQNGRIWHVMIDEDFKGADPLARWTVIGGECEVRDGELHMARGGPQILAFKGELPIDVRIEFEARQDHVYLNCIGCFLSAVSNATPKELPLTGYKFEIGGFDNSVDIVQRAGHPLVRRQASSLERGKTYRIRFERIGNRLRAIVDNYELFNVLDPDPLSGSDRTVVGLVGWLAKTIISRVKISTLGTPWKSDMLDIAIRQSLKGNYDVAMTLVKEVMESYPDPERLARARAAEQHILRRQQMTRDLDEWQKKLRLAWPDVPFDLRATNDGFTLAVENCGIKDLEPIRGLPLVVLICPNNQIRSLEPLKGMPLTTLNCLGNPISSLEPLRGMPLGTLVCEGCPVESLDPLRGLPITLLNISGGRVRDIEPLRGMPLTFLACWGNRIRSLEPLAGMADLSALYCSTNEIESLEPLRGMSIVSMNCSGNRIANLDPLHGMPLGVLHCGDNLIESLEPLRGMPLKMLSCQANRIRTLEPLRDAPLTSLVCGANLLTNCEPFLEQTPPDDFRYDCDTISVAELKRTRNTWIVDGRGKWHSRHVDILLAVRQNEVNELRKLALEFNGHHYLFVPKTMTWEESRAFCEKLGAHLLTVTSKEENDFVNSCFPNGSWFWFGLKTTEQGHEWTTGEPFTFDNFMDLQQQRKRGPKIFSGRWTADDVAGAHNSFMIEWDN